MNRGNSNLVSTKYMEHVLGWNDTFWWMYLFIILYDARSILPGPCWEWDRVRISRRELWRPADSSGVQHDSSETYRYRSKSVRRGSVQNRWKLSSVDVSDFLCLICDREDADTGRTYWICRPGVYNNTNYRDVFLYPQREISVRKGRRGELWKAN